MRRQKLSRFHTAACMLDANHAGEVIHSRAKRLSNVKQGISMECKEIVLITTRRKPHAHTLVLLGNSRAATRRHPFIRPSVHPPTRKAAFEFSSTTIILSTLYWSFCVHVNVVCTYRSGTCTLDCAYILCTRWNIHHRGMQILSRLNNHQQIWILKTLIY